MQDIYSQIDEPDGIEGVSAQLHVLDIEQQIIGHQKAGRWTAAQTWYEIKLAEKPDDVDIQVNLLNCLKESGQHGECQSHRPRVILMVDCRRPSQLRGRHANIVFIHFKVTSIRYRGIMGDKPMDCA